MKINNVFGNLFLNLFDCPIRFAYSQLRLNKFFFWKFYPSNLMNSDKNFDDLRILVKKNDFSFKDKVCLELGPGNSYFNAYNLLMIGAKSVILVDKFSRYTETKKQKQFFNNELECIRLKYNINNLFFIKNGKIDEIYIKFIEQDLTRLKIKEKVDFVLSINVFEHIKDVEGNIKKLSDIVKKGGLMYHSIDLRDHYNFNNPFLFLKYSRNLWDKYLTKEGVSYTNRLRYNEFKSLFEKYGFKIIVEQVERFPINRNRISSDFNKKEKDLDIGIWRVLFKKI